MVNNKKGFMLTMVMAFGMPMMAADWPDWANRNNAKRAGKFGVTYVGMDLATRIAEKALNEDSEGVVDAAKEALKETPSSLASAQIGEEGVDQNENETVSYGLTVFGQRFGLSFRSDTDGWYEWVSSVNGYGQVNAKKALTAVAAWFASGRIPG